MADEPRYQRKTKTYKLRFDDEEMKGLIVRMRTVSIAEMLDWSKPKNLEEEIAMASEFLISWNLDDEDGIPVPCNEKGLRSQPKPFFQAVITAMWEAAAGIAAPLVKPSSDGETFQDLAIPMETL